MKCIIILCLLSISLGSPITIGGKQYIKNPSWHIWKKSYQKSYTNFEQEKVRFAIWKDNIQHIIEHNLQNLGYTLEINRFGDLTNTEFRQQMNGFIMRQGRSEGSTFLAPSHVKINSTVDWRKKGYVTPVKTQGPCGSCAAMSATGALEGQHFKKTGQLVSLSDQQLIDCDTLDYGCNGGFMDNAFKYIKENGGIDSDKSYPYIARNQKCQFNKSNVVATVTGFVDIKKDDEGDLMKAAGTVGPVSVAFDAQEASFQFYKNGVYDPEVCSSTNLNHAALVVGYGTEEGKDYWLVKNSWGLDWGDSGYIKMVRNKNNKCGIAAMASYPLV